jgi:hypothetical protein
MHSGIVGRKGQWQLTFIQIEQVAKLSGAAFDILQGVVNIGHAQGCRRIRCQLHQSDGSLPRNGILAKIRFRPNDSVQ